MSTHKHALADLETTLHILNAPAVPTFKGTKMNQFRRQVEIQHWIEHQEKYTTRVSQEERDRKGLGKFYPWIVAARAEASAVARVGKAQAVMRRRKSTTG